MPHLAPLQIAGDLIFLSGQLAFASHGASLASDVAGQTRQCLINLERALSAQGLDRTAIVKTTVWLTRREDFGAFDETYAAFFGQHRPARSTTIAGLVIDGALVEIEAIAYVRS